MCCFFLCCFSRPGASTSSPPTPKLVVPPARGLTSSARFKVVIVKAASDSKVEKTEDKTLVHTARTVNSYRASLGCSSFYTTPTYPYIGIPTNFNKRISNEIENWRNYCKRISTKSADPVYFKILQLLASMESYFPIEIPSRAAAAASRERAKATEKAETDNRVRVIFNERLEVLVIACYTHRESDKKIFVSYIVKNPKKLNCRASKGAATACIRAIAQEAFDVYGSQAKLSCIGTGRGYHFFTSLGFLSADPIAKSLLDMPSLILRYFLSKSHEQSVQVLNPSIAPSF